MIYIIQPSGHVTPAEDLGCLSGLHRLLRPTPRPELRQEVLPGLRISSKNAPSPPAHPSPFSGKNVDLR